MLDVHPPHHAAATWRDFFIHIATIVIGLLIAVGLEQSIEALHHAHQRHLLLKALERDTELCADDSRAAASFASGHSAWLRNQEKILIAAIWSGHVPMSLPFEPQPAVFELPSDPQFQSGKSSGLLQLLSPSDMESFSEINFMIELSTDARKTTYAARIKRRAFENSFRGEDLQSLNLSRATQPELHEYLRLVDEERIETNQFLRMALETVGAASVVSNGERDLRKIQNAETQAMLKDPNAAYP